jgi:leucyl aminopeptidase
VRIEHRVSAIFTGIMEPKIEIRKGTAGAKADLAVILYHTDRKKAPSRADKEEWSGLRDLQASGQSAVLLRGIKDQRLYCAFGEEAAPDALEKARVAGAEALGQAMKLKASSVLVINDDAPESLSWAWIEGFVLASYQFLKYKSKKKEARGSVTSLLAHGEGFSDTRISEWNGLLAGVMLSRDLINEPLSHLTAEQFSKEMERAGKKAGFTTQILHKKQIEALRMGGLLGVNKGSIDPPTFTIMEYKPKKARNKKPVVLVGKGVVFDTGGLSLKPTPGSMDEMKCDMSGAAAVVGAMYAIASNNLPVHIIGLVPATDNRPGMNAIVPQDVITIMDGTTVEVMNTDAEGRLILADALVYAQRYKPELVIDLATLTGAAVRAVGTYASAVMGTAPLPVMDSLASSGMQTWERMVQFPLWNDYGEEIKSEVADIKNLGLGNAGQISAAKFLEHFVDYPWIHIDIAGPAWTNSTVAYRTRGGTGVGVRLLYHFLSTHFAKAE